MTNEQAHQRISTLHSLCDDYNNGAFDDMSKSLLAACNEMAANAYGLVKVLKIKVKTDDERATLRFYEIASLKIMIRVQTLKDTGRRETLEELGEFMRFAL